MISSKSLYRWIPSLYLMQGLPFALITAVSIVLYKNLNISNEKIAFFTSLFALPWFFKPLIAPLLESILDKKTLTVLMQILMGIIFLFIGLTLHTKHVFIITVFLFLIAASASSLHDICSDGMYIVHLSQKEKAGMVGARSLFYQCGKILAQGVMVFIVGLLAKSFNILTSWQILFISIFIFFLFITLYHVKLLPKTKKQFSKDVSETFKTVYKELFSTPGIASILLFTVFYEFPQSQLMKIVPLFMLGQRHGLALSTETVGLIYGGIGLIAMIIGIILSGKIIAEYEFKNCFIPLTFISLSSNVVYLFLNASTPVWLIATLIIIAQLGFGLSNGVYMVYLLQMFGKGTHPMSSFAVGTALMSLGTIIAGATSGYIQVKLGYSGFFIWILIACFMVLLFSTKVKPR